ncbi:MAG TPA: hypothetical protein VNN79_12835 [Actinomycetota bacterium]|nr:hypothetical protein [Actinomycetota bacterium]
MADDDRRETAASLATNVESLAAQERLADALTASDDLVELFGDEADPQIRFQVGRARSFVAILLMNAGRLEDAAALFDEVVRGAGDENGDLRRLGAAALATEARVLARLGRIDRALAALDELEGRGVDLDGLPDAVAEVLFARGFVMGHRGALDEAMASHEEVVRRFAESPSPQARAFAAAALHDTAAIWQRRGADDADERQLEVYDDVVRRFGDEDSPQVEAVVASSLLSKGNVLRGRGDAGATDAYREVSRRFGDADDPQVREVVAAAAAALVSEG